MSVRNTQSHHRRFADFPVGTRVKIVCEMQDMMWFDGETGTVTENKGRYLSITVAFDPESLRMYWSQTKGCQDRKCRAEAHAHLEPGPKEWGFNPADLLILGEVEDSRTVRDERDWKDMAPRPGRPFGGFTFVGAHEDVPGVPAEPEEATIGHA